MLSGKDNPAIRTVRMSSGRSIRAELKSAWPICRSAGYAAVLALALTGYAATAQDVIYFRIGAGAPGSVSFDLAGLVGAAISNPPGSRQCDTGGNCGVEGVLATAHAAASSVDNLNSLANGDLESTIAAADIASQAMVGSGPFEEQKPNEDLRAIADVGRLILHVLVPRGSEIKTGSELAGKKILVGAKNSDNALTAQFLLKAAGLGGKHAVYNDGDVTALAEEVASGKASALAIVDRVGSPDVQQFTSIAGLRLVTVEQQPDLEPEVSKLLLSNQIEASAYNTPESVSSIAVPLVWVVEASQDATLIENIARVLATSSGAASPGAEPSPAGPQIEFDVQHIGIPLHPGAQAAYSALPSAPAPAVPSEAPKTN